MGEFGLSERTAQRYIRAARLAAKTDRVSDLPPTVLYALSSKKVTDEVRDDIIERVKSGETFDLKRMRKLMGGPQLADPLSDESPKAPEAKKPRSKKSRIVQSLCSSPHYSELRGIIRWRSERPQKTI
jgi:hypothetical protein